MNAAYRPAKPRCQWCFQGRQCLKEGVSQLVFAGGLWVCEEHEQRQHPQIPPQLMKPLVQIAAVVLGS